jgi:hypothetical protein
LGAVLAEIESRELHRSWECSSIERFATWHCQITPGHAAATAAVGRALHTLPTVADAVVSGRLAIDKAATVVRVATPETEAALVDLAVNATVDQTRRICAAWRRVEDTIAGDAPTDTDDRCGGENAGVGRVVVIHDDDGVELRARFDHVHGAFVLAALESSTATVRAERMSAALAASTGDRPTCSGPAAVPAEVDERPVVQLNREQWRAEGLLRLCETAPAGTSDDLRPSGFTTQVVVHVPVDTLLDPHLLDGVEPGAVNVLEPRGAHIRRDAARWLACDAGLLTVLEDDNGDPLHLGPRTATVTPKQRRAVHARHRTCVWPGCTSTVVQLHHRHHRAFGGHDDIENLVPECRYHHGVIHRRDITVTRDHDGTIRHWRPDGTEILAEPPSVHPPAVRTADARHVLHDRQRSLGIDIDDPRRRPQWMNDPMRMVDAIDAIIQRRDASLRRTRPTGPTGATRASTPEGMTPETVRSVQETVGVTNRSRKKSST